MLRPTWFFVKKELITIELLLAFLVEDESLSQGDVDKSDWVFPRNLVDPASCHMLVSRTKPCKCESTRGLPREVCVRLIKRFIVYPTKDVHLPPQRDNFANCKANTCKNNLVPSKQKGDLGCLFVARGAVRRNKNQRRSFGSYHC